MWYKGINSYDLKFLKNAFPYTNDIPDKQYFLIYYMLGTNISYYDPPTIQKHEKYCNTFKNLVKIYGRTI